LIPNRHHGDTDSRKQSWHKSNLDNRWFENLLLHCGDIDGETTMASPSRRFKAFSWVRRAAAAVPSIMIFDGINTPDEANKKPATGSTPGGQ
jgi:hypothetical protein